MSGSLTARHGKVGRLWLSPRDRTGRKANFSTATRKLKMSYSEDLASCIRQYRMDLPMDQFFLRRHGESASGLGTDRPEWSVFCRPVKSLEWPPKRYPAMTSGEAPPAASLSDSRKSSGLSRRDAPETLAITARTYAVRPFEQPPERVRVVIADGGRDLVECATVRPRMTASSGTA